ncbi:MAG TPA: hypothetical protein VKS25_01015 [Solirubrobacteraceae bacterium]|nr:hypothetical protein [Solirubrobacteraceae bacterium]
MADAIQRAPRARLAWRGGAGGGHDKLLGRAFAPVTLGGEVMHTIPTCGITAQLFAATADVFLHSSVRSGRR